MIIEGSDDDETGTDLTNGENSMVRLSVAIAVYTCEITIY